MSDREQHPLSPPATSPAPPASSPTSQPLFRLEPTPVPTSPVPPQAAATGPEGIEDLQIFDWDEEEDETPAAEVSYNGPALPDLRLKHAVQAATVGRGEAPQSETLKPTGATGEPAVIHGVPEMPSPPVLPSRGRSGAQFYGRPKFLMARPPRPPVPARGRLKTVWRRLDLAQIPPEAPKDLSSRRPKPPATSIGRSNYSPPARTWALGESSTNALAGSQEDGGDLSPEWQTSKKKYWWRKDSGQQASGSGKQAAKSSTTGRLAEDRGAFKKQLAGRCYRCLASDHQVASCRDPVRCLRCRGISHFSSRCPSTSRAPISAQLRSRLSFPAGSIHSRLIFPELPQTTKQPPNPLLAADPAMARVPSTAAFRPALSRVAIVPSASMSAEAGRLLVHAVTITVQPGGYSPSTLEVTYALAVQLQVPSHNFRVTRLTSTSFVADFAFAPERDRAVIRSSLSIGGSALLIRPWRPAGGADESTWWYHVKITMENVPLEAWIEDGVKSILGDACIFDRFETQPASRDRASSQFLTCWVWMERPDALPRAVEYLFFAAKAGQAIELAELPPPNCIPSEPPVGKLGERVILVHLVGYEDWSLRSSDSSTTYHWSYTVAYKILAF